MVAFKLLLAAAASGLVTAWPEPTAAAYLDQRGIDCSKVTGALGVLKKLGPPATTFCSSYLKIPKTKTATTTFTPATVTETTSTNTVTVTSLACGQQKRNVPIDYRGFEYAKPNAVEGLEERGDVHPLLRAFAAAKISEGCSCLGLQPKATTTVTSTAAAPTTKVVATTTTCVESVPACVSDGGDCDLRNPGACCSLTCLTKGLGNFEGTCISF